MGSTLACRSFRPESLVTSTSARQHFCILASLLAEAAPLTWLALPTRKSVMKTAASGSSRQPSCHRRVTTYRPCPVMLPVRQASWFLGTVRALRQWGLVCGACYRCVPACPPSATGDIRAGTMLRIRSVRNCGGRYGGKSNAPYECENKVFEVTATALAVGQMWQRHVSLRLSC